jgi:hypothetical protein
MGGGHLTVPDHRSFRAFPQLALGSVPSDDWGTEGEDAMADMSGIDVGALREMVDRDAIFNLVRLERFWRDQCEWEKLEASYTEDGTVKVSWFEGSAREFVRRSREMHSTGTLSKHLIMPMHARIKGDRALAESYGQVQIRGRLEGVEYELINHVRFVSRVVRTASGWRLASFDCIYMRDVAMAVNPWERLPITPEAVARFRPSYRYLSLLLGARYPINQELPGDDRPERSKALYDSNERWFNSNR